jgi:ribosomal protein L33
MIKHLLGAEKKNVANLDTIGTLYRGHYLVTFTNGNVFGGDTVSVQWKHKIREEVSMAINDTFKFALKSYACSHKFYDSFQVRAYTSARLLLEKYSTPVLFYANNYLYGGWRRTLSFLHGTICRHIASY